MVSDEKLTTSFNPQVPRYRCLLCGRDNFVHRHQVERHVVSSHSGFGFACSNCKFLMNRRDQKHICKGGQGSTRSLVKRTTMTCTPEEKEEYHQYVKDSRSKTEQYMKREKIPMSDQGVPIPSRKRAIPTRPHVLNKKKRASTFPKEGRKEQLPVPTDTTTTALGLTITVPNNTCTRPPLSEDLQLSALSSDEEDTHQELETGSVAPSSGTEQFEDADEPTMTITIDEDTEIVDKDANQTDTVEKDADQADAPATLHASQAAHKLMDLATCQNQQVILNISGVKFYTSALTLQKELNSVLSRMVKKTSPLQPYYTERILTYNLDRNPEPYRYIIDYLRSGSKCTLPKGLVNLRKIYVEADFLELRGLQDLLEKKVLRYLKGQN